MKEDKIIYFELNHWMPEEDYPDEEPFISWMSDTYETEEETEKSWIKSSEELDKKFKDEGIVVVRSTIDMSANFCITAKESWVKENCPKLLTDYTEFLRTPEDDEELPEGRFGGHFVKYSEENCGIWLDKETEDGYELFKPEID